MSGARVVVVVGGGISGLAAAWRLVRASPGVHVIVLEASEQVGGKLRVGSVGGLDLDVGAESVLARRPEAVALMREIGLDIDIVHPVVGQVSVLARGELHPLPAGTVMGVPGRLGALEGLVGLLTEAELARVAAEPSIEAPAQDDDVDVASWVSARMGRAVVDRLVEPLLGGVYAGHADRLSLQATVPALWDRARRGGSLLSGPDEPRPAVDGAGQEGPAGRPGPVFAGLRGGVGRLAAALRDRLISTGAEVRTATTVRALRRTPTGWRLETGPASFPDFVDADAVLLAVPPAAAGRLLALEVPMAAAELAGIETASVAVVAAAFERAQLDGVTGSGLLIPPVEAPTIKAATFSSAKWAWVSDEPRSDLLAVRMSLGRAGEEATLQRPDDELAALAVGDLAGVLGRRLTPVDTTLIRWGGGLPQYAVGHVDRVARIRHAVAQVPGLAVCGAAMDGVGVAACIAAADRAVADLVARHLGAVDIDRGGTLEV